MQMMEMQERIRAKARELLNSKAVDCVLGYERASDGTTARPLFAYAEGDVEKLIFDNTCVHGLAKYLMNRKDKVTAIVAKPCDTRTVNLLVNEKQLVRDKVYIIGVTCDGILDTSWGRAPEKTQDRCAQCEQRAPVVYDFLIGDQQSTASVFAPAADPLAGKSAFERRAFWSEQFSRCIRCHACRQVCPGCYCSECFVDQLDPTWVGIRKNPADNEVWNTVRAFHLAGRCTSCNECERACPVNIPLSLLNRKLSGEVRDMFDFQSGMSAEIPAPFATFKKDEHLEGVE